MEDEQILNMCKEKADIIDAQIFDTGRIVVSDWPILKCAFGCDSYNRNWTCPPYNPFTPEKARRIIREYSRAILLRFDSNDYRKIYATLLNIEKELFSKDFYKAFALSMGPCPLCDECAVPEPCRHPTQRRPPIESLGIDLFATLERVGKPIHTLNREDKYAPFCIVLLE